MSTLQCVKGMHDILPDEMPRWYFAEGVFRRVVERFGYREVRTPILEPIDLFVRGIGETTDIVEKEMYTFVDKGGDHLALRPEGTASAIRAYIQHGVSAQEPTTKWYYVGPMFRRERPAKGRFRQFFQAGAEMIGVGEPTGDAEIIDMAVLYMRELGIDGIRVQINSLGDEESRPRFRAALVDFFEKHEAGLCEDCRRRLRTNPLRILDCKVESCRGISRNAPSVLEHLSSAAARHFEEVRRLLDRFGTEHEVVPSMVRGLDYYTGTIFEIQGHMGSLGAQTALVGGGRYDGLVQKLGGKPTPAIGFSFGIERLLMMLEERPFPPTSRRYYVAGVGRGGLDRAIDIARRLRCAGFDVEAPYVEGSLRSQLKRADRYRAAVAIIAGEDEAARGTVTLREMSTGEQDEIPIDLLESRLREAR